MKSKKRIIKIVILFLLLLLIFIIKDYNSIKVEGWENFEKAVLNNYSFVKNVNYDNPRSISLDIYFYINKDIERDEIEEVFNYTLKYLFMEEVFNDFKEMHKEKHNGYSFGKIYINLVDNTTKEIVYTIFASSESNGEPNNFDFKEWYISYKNEPSEKYYQFTN